MNKKPFKEFTSQEIDLMKKMYLVDFCGLERVWKHFRTCKKVIKRIFLQNNIRIRGRNEYSPTKIFSNENYFNYIDNPEKAQVLGFLYADGNVSKTCNTITVELSSIDYVYLNKIKECLSSEHSIKFRNHRNKDKINKSVVLSIKSPLFKRDLIKLGCLPCKSLILKFPTDEQISDKFISSFVLGYFEGDGSIHIKKDLQTNIEIVGTKELCEGIRKLTIEKLNIKGHLRKQNSSNKKNTYIFNIGGNQQVLKFCRWMYKDASFKMDRKYERFKKLESYYRSGRIISNKLTIN